MTSKLWKFEDGGGVLSADPYRCVVYPDGYWSVWLHSTALDRSVAIASGMPGDVPTGVATAEAALVEHLKAAAAVLEML